MPRHFCQGCFEKQIEVDRLKEEVHRLKVLLRYQQRTANEGFFGSSTPSSKIPIKPNSLENQQSKRGGARRGHPGHGRQAVEESEADCVVDIDIGDACPECGGELGESKGLRSRTVIDIQPVKIKKTVYRIWRRKCTQCGRIFQGKVPGVLPKSLFGNDLLSHIAVQHYIYGTPLGRLEVQLGIGIGSMIGSLHRLGRLFSDIPEKLILEYRESLVRHADETGWRNDGRSGYSWLFCTKKLLPLRKKCCGSFANLLNIPAYNESKIYFVTMLIECTTGSKIVMYLRKITSLSGNSVLPLLPVKLVSALNQMKVPEHAKS